MVYKHCIVHFIQFLQETNCYIYRGVVRTNRTSKIELFAKIVNGLKPLTIFAKKLHLRCLSGSNYVSDIIIICNFIQVYTLPTEYIKTILKAFVKFAGVLCPFAGWYFKKQTSVSIKKKLLQSLISFRIDQMVSLISFWYLYC